LRCRADEEYEVSLTVKSQGGHERLSVAVVLSFFLATALSSSALANEKTYGYRDFTGTTHVDGFKGKQGIRTDPAVPIGVAYVHPAQMDIGSAGNDFLAIGTYKGKGASGFFSCDNDFNPLWSVYVDGILGGAYFCQTVNPDAYGSAGNPPFTLEYGFCPSLSADRWLLFFGGVLWSCKQSASHESIQAIAGIETTTMSDHNIDVKYTALELNFANGSQYQDFGVPLHSEDPNYSYQFVSSTAFNVFLAPLD
jgi:hypothetical protein